MKTHQFIFVILLLCISHLQAQLGTINSLIIIPSNPTPSDSVKVICHSTFSSGGCQLVNSTVNITEFNITVNARHIVGPLAYICQATDTINLGLFSEGNYNVTYYLINDYNQIAMDTAFVNFNIQQLSGIENQQQQAKVKVKVYPNPFDEKTTLTIDKDINSKDIRLLIYDVLKQPVYQYKNITNYEIEINKGNLSTGIYFYQLFDSNKMIFTGKLIIR